MDETELDGQEVLETPEDVVTDPVEPSGDDTEDVEALKEKNKQLFARAKKAEGFELVDGKWIKPAKDEKPEPAEDTLSGKDALLLAKAGVDMEDLDEVTGFAKYRGITIKEALDNKTLKTILAERVEERKSAQVAQTKGPRGTSKETPEQLIEKARSGNEVDPDKLAEARMAGKLGN